MTDCFSCKSSLQEAVRGGRRRLAGGFLRASASELASEKEEELPDVADLAEAFDRRRARAFSELVNQVRVDVLGPDSEQISRPSSGPDRWEGDPSEVTQLLRRLQSEGQAKTPREKRQDAQLEKVLASWTEEERRTQRLLPDFSSTPTAGEGGRAREATASEVIESFCRVAERSRASGEELKIDGRFVRLLSALEVTLRKRLFEAVKLEEAAAKSDLGRGQGAECLQTEVSAFPPEGAALSGVAKGLLRLRLSVGVDDILRSLVLLGVKFVNRFSLNEASDFLLALDGIRHTPYKPVSKLLLRSLRSRIAHLLLEELRLCEEKTKGAAGELPGDEVEGVVRRLLSLVPVFASGHALQPELPECFEIFLRRAVLKRPRQQRRHVEVSLNCQEALAASQLLFLSESLRRERRLWRWIRRKLSGLRFAAGDTSLCETCQVLKVAALLSKVRSKSEANAS